MLGTTMQAQVTIKINASPDELKSLSRRTLLVEMPEPNPKVADGFSKKTKEEETEAYMASLASYREQIEPAIRKYWTFNEKIEFASTSEVVRQFEKKSKKYVALIKAVLPNGGGAPGGYTFGMGVPALVLTRTDGDSKVSKKGELRLTKHDFQAYLVISPDEKGKEDFNEASMKLTLSLCQDFLQWNIRNKKSEPFMNYLKKESKANCSKLRQRQLVVDEDNLYKKRTPQEISEAYGREIEFVDHAGVEQIYMSGDESKAVLFSIPVGTLSGSVGLGPLAYSNVALAYTKIIVDPSNNQVINAIVPGMGKTYVQELLPMDMRQLAKCE